MVPPLISKVPWATLQQKKNCSLMMHSRHVTVRHGHMHIQSILYHNFKNNSFFTSIVVLSLCLAVSKLNKLISLCRLYAIGRTSNNRSIFSWYNFLYCMLYFCIFRLFCFSFPWSVPLLEFFWLSYFFKSYFFCVDSEVWCQVK